MLNRRNLFVVVCVLILLLATAALSVPRLAFGQATIPTRTPVPDGGSTSEPEPEPTDDDGGDGGDWKQPTPTHEPEPTPVPSLPPATAVPTLVIPTNTPVVVASDTPIAISSATVPPATETPTATATVELFLLGEEAVDFPPNNQSFPQAGPCGVPPTFTSLDANRVFAGPDDAYPLVSVIVKTEVRPIVGRAAFADWWVIQLDGTGHAGWIADESGIVNGYTGRVPIISAPDLNGIAPTPGGNIWVPTPDASCSAPELLAAVAVDKADDNGQEAPPSGKPDSLDNLTALSQSEDGKSPLIQTEGDSGVLDEGQTDRSAAADPLLTELADSAAPLELPGTATSQLPNLMPVAGIVLILAALIIGLLARKNRSGINQ